MEESQNTDLFVKANPGEVGCPKCGKAFKNDMALRMHNLRIHSGRGWDTGQNFRSKSTLSINERKRAYQKKLRARYKREGLTSRGQPRRKNPLKWTTERHIKFSNTMRRLRARREMAKNKAMVSDVVTRLAPKSRIRYVYPEPGEPQEPRGIYKPAYKIEELQPVTKPVMRYCPYCGENIERHIVYEKTP